MSGVPDDIKEAAREAMSKALISHEGRAPVEYIEDALMAERKHAADVAAGRVGDLYEGALAVPADGQFASQMVEAMLIWQRITDGYRPKDLPPDLSDWSRRGRLAMARTRKLHFSIKGDGWKE